MPSLPCNVSDSLPSPAAFRDRKTIVLTHIARSGLVEVRPASWLEVRPRPEMLTSGVQEVDAITGGIPRGCLTELCGAHSSGKTSVLLAAMAAATKREETCVLIDASDSFDPRSGDAAGIDFDRLLWVRCGGSRSQPSAVGRRSSATHGFAESQEPTTESRLSRANDQRRTAYDERRTSNEPGAESQEPRAEDRRPKTDDVQQLRTRSERRLEQVLKTTDLILQSGGFGLVALDLAGIPEKFVRRIPLASWFRFQRAVEHTKTALLVVSDIACARSRAALVLKLQLPVASCQFSRDEAGPSLEPELSRLPTHAELLEQMQVEVELVRSRLERKPMQSVKRSFTTQAVRAG